MRRLLGWALAVVFVLIVALPVAVDAADAPPAPVVTTTTTTLDHQAIGEAALRQQVAIADGQAARDLELYLDSIPPPTTTTTAPPAEVLAPATVQYADGSVWDRLAACESGGNWSYPPVSGGYSGGIMFYIGTWRAMGGTAYAPDAYLATREQQIAVAEKVLASGGWGQWPGCSSKLGLR